MKIVYIVAGAGDSYRGMCARDVAVVRYRELIERTGGGQLYDPDVPGALSVVLAELARDRERARELGVNAAKGVRAHFSAQLAVAATLTVYQGVLGSVHS